MQAKEPKHLPYTYFISFLPYVSDSIHYTVASFSHLHALQKFQNWLLTPTSEFNTS